MSRRSGGPGPTHFGGPGIEEYASFRIGPLKHRRLREPPRPSVRLEDTTFQSPWRLLGSHLRGMKLLRFPRPVAVLSQVPKCEAPGAPTFIDWSHFSRHLVHPPIMAVCGSNFASGYQCPATAQRLLHVSRSSLFSKLPGIGRSFPAFAERMRMYPFEHQPGRMNGIHLNMKKTMLIVAGLLLSVGMMASAAPVSQDGPPPPAGPPSQVGPPPQPPPPPPPPPIHRHRHRNHRLPPPPPPPM